MGDSVFHSPSSFSSLFTLSSVLSVIEEAEEAEAVRADGVAEGQFSSLVLLGAEVVAVVPAAVLVVSVAVVPAVVAEQAEAGKKITGDMHRQYPVHAAHYSFIMRVL